MFSFFRPKTLLNDELFYLHTMVEKGQKVSVEYTGTFDDGTVFDSSQKHGQPLEFVAGEGQVVKGFDEAVLTMTEGEEKEIHLEPKDAYGEPNKELHKKVPKDQVPEGMEPQVGQTIGITLQDGQQFPAQIVAVGDTEITLDLNHPLAGKALNFKLKLVKVE